MRKFKRLITALLASMLLSLNATSFAYYTGVQTEEDVVYSDQYIMAENTLYGLGILPERYTEGYEDGMTRAEFAAAVSALTGGKTVMPAEPVEENITLIEAAKMIIASTENTIRLSYYGEDDAGYLALAGDMGVTHGLSGMQSYAKLTYGTAVQILYNSMRVTPGEVSEYSDKGASYKFDEKHTVLTEYLDIIIKTGFVTADNFWSLNPNEKPSFENGLVINGASYKVEKPIEDDYVGFEVNYYYDTEENVIRAIEKGKKSQKVVLYAENLISFVGNEYHYNENGKSEEYKLAANPYIVSNFSANMAANVDMLPLNSDIILVDANGDERYETVFIKTYEEVEVQTLDQNANRLASKDGDAYVLDRDKPARVYLNGQAVDYKKVTSSVHASVVLDANNIVREMYLSTSKAKGTVKGYDTSSRMPYVTIDDEVYPVANNMINKNNLKISVAGEFVLNFKGEVVNLRIGEGSGVEVAEIGYLIDIKHNDNDNIFTVKYLNKKGNVVKAQFAEKARVNNVKVNDVIPQDLKNGDQTIKRQLITYMLDGEGKIKKMFTAQGAGTVAYGDYKLHLTLSDPALTYAYGSFNGKILKTADTVVFSVPTYASVANYDYVVMKELASKQTFNVDIYTFEPNAPVADVVIIKRSNAAGRAGACGGPGGKIDNQYGSPYIVTGSRVEYNENYGIAVDVIEYFDLKTGQKGKKILADNASWYAYAYGGGGEVKHFNLGAGRPATMPTTGAPGDLKAGDLFFFSENTSGEIGTVGKFYDASDRTLVSGVVASESDGTEKQFNYAQTDQNTADWVFDVSFYVGARYHQGFVASVDKSHIGLTQNTSYTPSTATRADVKLLPSNDRSKIYNVIIGTEGVEVTACKLQDIMPHINDANKRTIVHDAFGEIAHVVNFTYE